VAGVTQFPIGSEIQVETRRTAPKAGNPSEARWQLVTVWRLPLFRRMVLRAVRVWFGGRLARGAEFTAGTNRRKGGFHRFEEHSRGARETRERRAEWFTEHDALSSPSPPETVLQSIFQSIRVLDPRMAGKENPGSRYVTLTRLRCPRSRGGGSGNRASQLHRNDLKIRFGV